MKKIKVCSLFSGIGGFETGLFQAFGKERIEVVFSSEIDKYASKSYEILYGHAPHGDITKVQETDIPNHDLLVGGFPCQDFSLAGRQAGFEGTRGTLFFEIARIAKEKRPKLLLLENVKNLVNHGKGKTIEVIMKTLSDLGYALDFAVLNSKFFDVAQNRERVYIVGVLDGKQEGWKLEGKYKSVTKAKKRIQEIEGMRSFNFPFPKEECVTKRLKDILEETVDEKLFLDKEKEEKLLHKVQSKEESDIVFRIDDKRGGNSIHSWELSLRGVITEKEQGYLNQMILERRKGEKDGNPILPEQVGATKEEFDTFVEMGYLKRVGERYDFKFGNLSFDISKIISQGAISPTLTCTDSSNYAVLTKEEVGLEFVGGVTDKPNWLDNGKELSRNYKQGSRVYDTNGLSSTLSAQGVGGLGGHTGLYLTPNWRIRRLSPLECFRLQGFPDSYYYDLKEQGISNTQLYKMAGNAVTSFVIKEIAKNIPEYLFSSEESGE